MASQVVEGGDGGGEVPLGGVELLDVPRDVAHHGLRLARLGLDVPDLREQLRDGCLRLLERRRRVLPHVRLIPNYPPEDPRNSQICQ